MIKTIPASKPGTILRVDRGHWAYQDLQEMGETQDRCEIIDGVLFMSPSGHVQRHQETVGNLYYLLRGWVTKRDQDKVYISPADVVISADRVVQPDLFFVAKERLDIVDAYVSGAPDLMMEVLSPASVKYDRETKFSLYEDAGVKEYWIADPEARRIDVFSRRGERFEEIGQFKEGEQAPSALLDGFAADVSAVFS